MKIMKKATVSALSLTLLLSMAVPTMAAGADCTITINDAKDTPTYEAYQIFEYDFAADNSVSSASWGDSINDSAAFLSALQKDPTLGSTFDDCDSALSVAQALGDKDVTADQVAQFAKIASQNLHGAKTELAIVEGAHTASVSAGYYLVENTTAAPSSANAIRIMDVTEDVSVSPKAEIPTVEKKVLEDTDIANYTETPDSNYNDVADWDIGETKSFRLYGTIPANEELANYETYKFVFHDSFDAGISVTTPLKYSVSYIVDGVSTELDPTTFTATEGTNTITFACNDLKTVLGDKLGQNPTIVITYSAMLNEKAQAGVGGNQNGVYLEFTEGEGTGTTTQDKVIVFTYDLSASKVDGEDTSVTLGDAEFILMNAAKDQYAVVKDGVFQEWTEDETLATKLVSDKEDGTFSVKGLDADTYFLRETKAPVGYNPLIEDLELVISASYAEDAIYQQGWTSFDSTMAIDKVSLTVDGDETTDFTIANFTGFNLPETGGFGTTLIYTLGGILVLGVSVILVSKKRMTGKQ